MGDMVDRPEHRSWNSESFNDSADGAEVFRIEAEVFFGDFSGLNDVPHQLPIPERDKHRVAGLEAGNGQVGVDGVRATRAWIERNINDLDLRAHGLEFG